MCIRDSICHVTTFIPKNSMESATYTEMKRRATDFIGNVEQKHGRKPIREDEKYKNVENLDS